MNRKHVFTWLALMLLLAFALPPPGATADLGHVPRQNTVIFQNADTMDLLELPVYFAPSGNPNRLDATTRCWGNQYGYTFPVVRDPDWSLYVRFSPYALYEIPLSDTGVRDAVGKFIFRFHDFELRRLAQGCRFGYCGILKREPEIILYYQGDVTRRHYDHVSR